MFVVIRTMRADYPIKTHNPLIRSEADEGGAA